MKSRERGIKKNVGFFFDNQVLILISIFSVNYHIHTKHLLPDYPINIPFKKNSSDKENTMNDIEIFKLLKYNLR